MVRRMSQYVATHKRDGLNLAIYLLFPIKGQEIRQFVLNVR